MNEKLDKFKIMKNFIFSFTLLILVLLLGCSEKDEQLFVLFETQTLKSDSNGGILSVEVKANCNWEIVLSNSEWAKVSTTHGTGNYTLKINISQNTEYNEREVELYLTSEDHYSNSTLKILQDEKKGILSDDGNVNIEIPAKGGEFVIGIKENVDDILLETPSWILISNDKSKSLQNNSYLFIAETNNSYEKRVGEIVFKSNETELKYHVTQKAKSIVPEGVEIKDFHSLVKGKQTLVYDIECYPTGADMSMLSFLSSDETICKASTENNKLKLNFIGYGKSTISCFVNDQIKCVYNVECVDTDTPFLFKSIDDDTEFPFNSFIWFSSNKDFKYIEVTVSDNTIISQYTDKNRYRSGNKTGKVIVTGEYTLTGEKISINLEVVPFVVKANILSTRSTADGAYFVFVTTIKTNDAIENKTFVIKDENDKIVDNNGGTMEGNHKYISPEIFVRRTTNMSNIVESVKKYKITVSGDMPIWDHTGVKMEKYSVTKNINTSVIGDLD